MRPRALAAGLTLVPHYQGETPNASRLPRAAEIDVVEVSWRVPFPPGAPLIFSVQDSGTCRTPAALRLRALTDGTSLASLEAMSEIAVPSTYNEPTVMWRMRQADGRRAQVVIDPMSHKTRVLWFVNGQPLGIRYFDDWTGAIAWTERLRAKYSKVGWCLSDDIAPPPTPSS